MRVTIGQAAAFVGVTVKTVRHYHKLGLVAEPGRDSSGYRRYGSAELVRLVRIRTLAAAGVPLAGIGSVLDAGPAAFAAALDQAERQLTDRIEDLLARRDALRRLAREDWTLLPERATVLLDGMPEVGFAEADVTTARESFVLAKALVPEGFEDYLAAIERAVRDPEFLALTRRTAEVSGWDPADPRIAELAGELAVHYLANPDRLKIVTGLQARTEAAARYRMIAHHGEASGSAAARLSALVEEKLRAAGEALPP